MTTESASRTGQPSGSGRRPNWMWPGAAAAWAAVLPVPGRRRGTVIVTARTAQAGPGSDSLSDSAQAPSRPGVTGTVTVARRLPTANIQPTSSTLT